MARQVQERGPLGLLLAFNHSRVLLPWFRFARSTRPMDRLHRLSLAWERAAVRGWGGTGKLLVEVMAWPAVSALQTALATRCWGTCVRRRFKVPIWRQVLDQILLANFSNIAPASYYKFELFRREERPKALLYVQHHEIAVLLPGLNRDLDTDSLDDKRRFFENCRSRALPVVPCLAALNPGGIEWLDPAAAGVLPAGDLIVKPTDLCCGAGLRRFRFAAETGRWTEGERSFGRPELLSELAAVALTGCHLLQPALSNHRAIRPLAGRGLATVRVVTCRSGAAEFAPLMAAFRMPTGPAAVDNFTAGGLAASVSIASGILGAAIRKAAQGETLDCHPDSGARITGTELPLWPAALDLCRRAHRAFPAFPFIGWDIVLTDAGPLLLEANLTWGAELVQMTNGKPLGETPFAAVFLGRVDNA